MGWTESIAAAIKYIEEHLCDEITPELVAKEAAVSQFYFEKGFAMLCGMTISEYIRGQRRAFALRRRISETRYSFNKSRIFV